MRVERRRMWWALGACAALAFALRAPYLGAALGIDEGGVAYIARNWAHGHGSLYGSYWLDRPPLLVLLYRAAVQGGATGIRLLGAVAALVIVVATALLARAVGGDRAGRIAGLLAALGTGSAAIGAVYTPAELLAAAPATLSMLALVTAHRTRRSGPLFAAAVLAVVAVFVKQSFLDAGAAGTVFVVLSATRDRRVRVRWPLVWVGGAALPVLALLIWQAVEGLPVGAFADALFGFRLDALVTLAGSGPSLTARMTKLAGPALWSAMPVGGVMAAIGIYRLRGDPVLAVTLVAWLLAALVGVLAGGSYWPHYLIELVPVLCVCAATALAPADVRLRWGVLAAATCAAVLLTISGGRALAAHPRQPDVLAVAHYLRTNARPGDTQYVMYARANLAYYSGLPSPFPYMWSLMMRVRKDAQPRLRRLIASPQRPTWLIEWQPAGSWRLDRGKRLRRLVAREYRLAARVGGHRIFVRADRLPALRLTHRR